MSVKWMTAFLDLPDDTFEASCSFWAEVTGTTLSAARGAGGEFATLLPADGDAHLRVQRTADGSAGCHLDLHVDDVAHTADHAVALGATVTGDLDDDVVLRSPAGLGFCITRHRGESQRTVPHPSPGGRSSVDQLCIDIAPQQFADECEFWQALTGWELRAAMLPCFSYLVRPDAMPLRLLFQRLDAAEPGRRAHAHLDLACTDRDALAEHHQRLGARLPVRFDHWTTLIEPSGLAYCLTGRDPDTGQLPPST